MRTTMGVVAQVLAVCGCLLVMLSLNDVMAATNADECCPCDASCARAADDARALVYDDQQKARAEGFTEHGGPKKGSEAARRVSDAELSGLGREEVKYLQSVATENGARKEAARKAGDACRRCCTCRRPDL